MSPASVIRQKTKQDFLTNPRSMVPPRINSITTSRETMMGSTVSGIRLCGFLLSLSYGFTLAEAQTPLDDTNFREALDLYKNDEAAATSTYGAISEWDVTQVTDMSELELGAEFLADLSQWNVSRVTDMAEVRSLDG